MSRTRPSSRLRIAIARIALAAIYFYAPLAKSEMHICKRPDGTSVFRNMACSINERTVSINGVSPEEWQRRSNEKYIADALAREKEVAEAARQAANAAKAGGLAETVKSIAEAGALGLRAIVDPMGAAKAMAGKK